MKSRALAFAVVLAAVGSLAVAAARSGAVSVVPGVPTGRLAAAGQIGLAQFLAACPCAAELTRVTEANARVGALQQQLADVNRRLGDNQASQATAQANLKNLRAEFDKHRGGGVGSDTGTFVRGDDGREVRYNAQGQIETYQNGKPVPGTAKPSPYMTGLKSKIDAEEATLKKLQDERAQLEQQQQQANRDLAQATSDAAAAAAALKACLERCRTSQPGSTAPGPTGIPAQTQTGSTAPAQAGSQAAAPAGSATPDPGTKQPSPAPARDINWALDDRLSLNLGLRYNLGDSRDTSGGSGAATAKPGTTSAASGVPADVAPASSSATWLDPFGALYNPRLTWGPGGIQDYTEVPGGFQPFEPSVRIGDTLEERLEHWSRYTELEYAAELGSPIIKDRPWVWGSYGGTAQGLNDRLEGKLTAQIDPRHSLIGSYLDNRGPSNYTGLLTDSFFATARNDAARVEDTHVFNSNLYLTGLYSTLQSVPPRGPVSTWGQAWYETERPQGSAAGGYPPTSHPPYRYGAPHFGPDQFGENEDPQGSSFFNAGSLSHELKFGAGYRNAEVQSTSTFGGGTLLPGDQQWQFIDGFWTPTPTSAGAPVPAVGLEPEYVIPRLGSNYSLGTERKTSLRQSYSRFADQLGTGTSGVGSFMPTTFYTYRLGLVTESWRHADGVWADSYLAGSALQPRSGLEPDDGEPRSRLHYSLAEAMEAFPGQSFWRFADELPTGFNRVGSINALGSSSYRYFYTGRGDNSFGDLPDLTDRSLGFDQLPNVGTNPPSFYNYSSPIARELEDFRTNSYFANDSWRSIDKWQFNTGARYDEPELPAVGTNPTRYLGDVPMKPRPIEDFAARGPFFALNNPNTVQNAGLSGQPADDRYQLFIIVYVNGQVVSKIRIAERDGGEEVSPRPFTLASAARSARELFRSWFGFAPLHAAATSHRSAPLTSLAPGTLVRVSAAQGQRPQAAQGAGPAVSLVATGASSGDAFNIQVVDPSGQALRVVAPDGLVLQPIRQAANRPAAPSAASAAAAADPASKIVGYCLEFLKPPPPKDALYQVAPSALQQKYAPMRRILEAGRALTDSGLLKPDSDPAAYATFIQQWALWTKLENWNFGDFSREFVDRTRKNVANMGREWTPVMETALKTAAPNRFNDIMAVLLEAETLRRNETPAP